ncbi:MAG: ABC transporter permease subunit [Bacteroidota bacterium]|nr:ABC transporter permease subunit [Bacteroidota bacterium]
MVHCGRADGTHGCYPNEDQLTSMLGKILNHEIRLLRRDRTAWIILTLLAVLMMYAAVNGRQEQLLRQDAAAETMAAYQTRIAEAQRVAEALEAEMREDSLSLDTYDWGPRDPYNVGSSLGHPVILPPLPLARFAIGQSDLYPSSYRVSAASSVALGQSDQLENPFKLLVGHFDLAFVTLFLYPLLILTLTFALTAEEKDSGTLRLVMTQPVSLSTLVWAKVLSRSGLLVGAALMLMVVAFVVTGAAFEGGWDRFGLWLIITLLYGSFWFGLALLVSAFGRSAATNAIILAVCWLAFVVILPSLINVVAGTLYPVPSRMAFVTAMRAETTVAEQQSSESLAKFLHDHPEIAPVSDDEANFAMLRVVRDERIAEQLAPVMEQFVRQQERQHEFVRALGYLSPTLVTHGMLLDAAGTGQTRYKIFRDQVDAFQASWQEHFVPKYFASVAFQSADYDTMPRFEYREVKLAELLDRLVFPALFLTLITAILGGIGLRQHRKYPVAE